MSNNKTNILLLFTSVLFSLILIETYSYRKVKGKLKYGIKAATQHQSEAICLLLLFDNLYPIIQLVINKNVCDLNM